MLDGIVSGVHLDFDAQELSFQVVSFPLNVHGQSLCGVHLVLGEIHRFTEASEGDKQGEDKVNTVSGGERRTGTPNPGNQQDASPRNLENPPPANHTYITYKWRSECIIMCIHECE